MSSEKFSLKCIDFQANVSNSFVKLRNETNLMDVILVGNDYQQVRAHKLVLSACSDVFQEIFNHNTSTNLVLYLESVDSKEINFILDYIYQGEVQIFQENLDRFIEIAEKFRLGGLLGGNENSEHQASLNVKEEEYNLIKDQEVEKSMYDKMNVPATKIVISSNHSIDSSISKFETHFLEPIIRENNVFRCTVCNRTMKWKRDMNRHMETHLSGLSYECPVCGKSFRSTNSLVNHKSLYHRP